MKKRVKDFSEEQKMAAVKMFVGGTSRAAVADLFKVSVQSISAWTNKYKDRVPVQPVEVQQAIVIASDKVEQEHEKMTLNAIEKTNLVIDILYTRIKESTDEQGLPLPLDSISRALTAINNCVRIAPKGDDGTAKNKGNFFNHIESLIIQNNAGNPNFLKPRSNE